MKNNKNQIEITIQDLFNIFIKKFWIIVTVMVIFASIAFLYSKYYIVPLYRSEVMFLIDPTYNVDYTDAAYTEYNKLQMAQYSLSIAKQLANTYMQILQTRDFKEKLNKEYKNLYNKNMNGAISVIAIEDTDLFKIIVVSPAIADAYNIAQLVEKIAPEHITEIMGAEKIRVTDGAVKPLNSINDTTRRNVMLGAVLGAVIVYGISFLLYIFDTKVKDEEDLRNHYDIPILGGVIDFNSIKTNKKN